MVFVAEPSNDHVVVENSTLLATSTSIDPYSCKIVPEKNIFPRVLLVAVKDLQKEDALVVMVWLFVMCPELLSNTTSSADVGVTAPGVPPELVDQLLAVFQLVLDEMVFTQ